MWGVVQSIGGIAGAAPVVSVSRATTRLMEIHFATPLHGNLNWHFLYESVSSHADVAGDLKYWSKGKKIETPEWANDGKTNLRSCWTRGKTVTMRVKLVSSVSTSTNVELVATPKLDGDEKILGAATVKFAWPAGSKEMWVNVPLVGKLPQDEIGRFVLSIKWELRSKDMKFAGPKQTKHWIYSIYGPPLDPDYDSNAVADTGAGHETSRSEGTLSGTRKRLDFMMGMIGSSKRHKVDSKDELVDLYWRLHKAINDTPGAPPYFNAKNNKHISVGPDATGKLLPVEDNWLAFATTPGPKHWNDASCIGHVQIMKTMLAAVGLFSRRTWVYPHTSKTPDGKTKKWADTDLYSLGKEESSKLQTWLFASGSDHYWAQPKLMEPDDAWENYEACMLSPTGKFLTGGYSTSSNPASFRANKGFDSATELLRWWSNTKRPKFGKRFMAWVHADPVMKIWKIWDVDGVEYDWKDYTKIRDNGKELPPP